MPVGMHGNQLAKSSATTVEATRRFLRYTVKVVCLPASIRDATADDVHTPSCFREILGNRSSPKEVGK